MPAAIATTALPCCVTSELFTDDVVTIDDEPPLVLVEVDVLVVVVLELMELVGSDGDSAASSGAAGSTSRAPSSATGSVGVVSGLGSVPVPDSDASD